MQIRSVASMPLSVPLLEPFVIASAELVETRAVLVTVELADERSGRVATGLGEAAALPPVTAEDQPELLALLERAAQQLVGTAIAQLDGLAPPLEAALGAAPVARAALESALLDAWARLERVPVCTLLRGRAPRRLVTDITLPIVAAARVAQLATAYRARGFNIFKVKVGKCLDDDVRALEAAAAAVPDAIFRLDANGGYDAKTAMRLMTHVRAAGLTVECFEQPCHRDDLEGMAEVTRAAGVPVIADESVRDLADLERVLAHRAADGVNLKLVKAGGLLASLAIAERARAHGLRVMCGGMVETRLGMTAMAHVACALDAVDYLDLDTAFLLAADPFRGGYRERGATLELPDEPGFALAYVG